MGNEIMNKLLKEVLNEMKQNWIVYNTSDNNNVVGMASDEGGAKKALNGVSRRLEIDKSELKIKYVKKKQMIGQPLSEKLDPVGKEDADVDNDGDVDDSDKYLKNRRKEISKDMKNESSKVYNEYYSSIQKLDDKNDLNKLDDLILKDKKLSEQERDELDAMIWRKLRKM